MQMPHTAERDLHRWNAALYLCVAAAMLSVMGMALWGVVHDLEQVRKTFIGSEMERLRSHAERTVKRIQNDLSRNMYSLDDRFKNESFLREHWDSSIEEDDSRTYAAIVDTQGKVFMHYIPKREGGQLAATWYDSIVPEGGDDVVDTKAEALTSGIRSFDVRVPIVFNGEMLGNYHTGMTHDWLVEQLQVRQVPTKQLWGLILMGIVISMLVAGASMFQISRRIAVMREAMKVARVRRFAEVGQLMAGIVHEIRNPLNSMRLNLHVLGRCLKRQETLDDDEPEQLSPYERSQVLQETNDEIERVERLMRILLGYARPDQPQPECLDVRQELESTLMLLRPMLERAEVVVKAQFFDTRPLVLMDRDRLRQMLINLINNAKEATGPGGEIHISVDAQRSSILLTVADNGPGVSVSDRDRIFEPFYSTKENGTGLGLALVRRFAEEAGGSIVCDANEPCGCKFRMELPKMDDALRQQDSSTSTNS